MVDRYNPPTRAQIAAMAQGDDRMVRALEQLFRSGGQDIPDNLVSLEDDVSELQVAPSALTRAVANLNSKQNAIASFDLGQIVFVSDRHDFPKPVAGVITLENETIYVLTNPVDLDGDRILGAANNTISGYGTNISRLTSTGLTGAALLTTTGTLALLFVAIHDVDEALDMSGSAGDFIDWVSVNFENCATIGTIENYDNAIFINLGILASANLTFDGTIGTIGFGDSIFSGIAGETTIIIPATATITRRFRAKFCAFVTPTGGTGVDFDVAASVPDESYIYFECNFSGSGTALAGVLFNDNKAMFSGNLGIENSRYFAQYYMTNNAVTTPVTVSIPTKALGTTTANSLNQKFSHSDNRATYTGALTRTFEVEAWASLTSNNNNVLRLYIAKNGTAITTTFAEITANAGGRAEGLVTASVVEMNTNDYVEVFVSNETGSNAITNIHLNTIVSEL